MAEQMTLFSDAGAVGVADGAVADAGAPCVMGVHVSAIWTPEGMHYFGHEPGRAFLVNWFEDDAMWARVVATYGADKARAWIDQHGLKKGAVAAHWREWEEMAKQEEAVDG